MSEKKKNFLRSFKSANRQVLQTSILVLILVICLYACKKEGGNDDDSSSFTDKRWAIESVTINPAVDIDLDGDPDTDMTILLDNCDKDDMEIYKSNQKIVSNTGSNHCDDEETQEEETGTWQYDSGTKILTIHKSDDDPLSVNVQQITSRRLSFTYVMAIEGENYTISAVYRTDD